MKKIKKIRRTLLPAAEGTSLSAAQLRESIDAAAHRLIGAAQPAVGSPDGGLLASQISENTDGALSNFDAFGLAALKERCKAFGIDATNGELVLAGLCLLREQTETALEVAMLRSLRADRTSSKRRSRRM